MKAVYAVCFIGLFSACGCSPDKTLLARYGEREFAVGEDGVRYKVAAERDYSSGFRTELTVEMSGITDSAWKKVSSFTAPEGFTPGFGGRIGLCPDGGRLFMALGQKGGATVMMSADGGANWSQKGGAAVSGERWFSADPEIAACGGG